MASHFTTVRIAVGEEDHFDSKLGEYAKKATEKKAELLVLVTGEKDEKSGKSWCPDCQKAEPLVHKALKDRVRTVILVEAPVNRAHYKGQLVTEECDGDKCFRKVAKTHPYRTHAQLKVTAIPTLYRWDLEKNIVIERLIESEVYDVDKLNSFMSRGTKEATSSLTDTPSQLPDESSATKPQENDDSDHLVPETDKAAARSKRKNSDPTTEKAAKEARDT